MTLSHDLTIEELEGAYCSQGDTSGKRSPKKYFARAMGSYLFDGDGTKYLDFQMFNSAANFGYQNERHLRALESQLRKLPSLSAEFMHDERVVLSARIAKYIEEKFSLKGRVHFSVGGAQAIDDALRIVANYSGSKNVFVFEGAYHGRTIAASSLSASYRYRKYSNDSDQPKRVPYPYCYRCAYGKQFPECEYYCVSQFQRLFESEFQGVIDFRSMRSEYKALFFEPVLGRGGYVVPPVEYFKRLKKILDDYQILFVDDEVQMGFFRTGKLFAIEHFGIAPDVIVFGKALTNGLFPLSGLWAREELIDPDIWPPGSSHATFAAHPLATAAGLATFDLMESHDFETTTKETGDRLKEAILAIQQEFKIFGRVDALGLAFGLEVCEPGTDRADPILANRISENALNNHVSISGVNYGLILTTGGYLDNVFLLSPSLFTTEPEILLFADLLKHAIKRALEEQ